MHTAFLKGDRLPLTDKSQFIKRIVTMEFREQKIQVLLHFVHETYGMKINKCRDDNDKILAYCSFVGKVPEDVVHNICLFFFKKIGRQDK
jgi:hypothetical protein